MFINFESETSYATCFPILQGYNGRRVW